jgi:hypothetical protein
LVSAVYTIVAGSQHLEKTTSMKSFLDNFGPPNPAVAGNKGWELVGSQFIPYDTHAAFPENSIALATLDFAEARKLPADKQKVLRESSSFHEIHSVTNLPRTIVALCADCKGEFAEPGRIGTPATVSLPTSGYHKVG